MGGHIFSLPLTINTLILFSALISAGARAQDDASYLLEAQSTPSEAAMQVISNNDCYKGNRNRRLMFRVADLSTLWRYASRMLLPTTRASAASNQNSDTPKIEKGLDWRVGANKGGVVVSVKVAW